MSEIDPLYWMQYKDIEQVVQLHLRTFSGFFLSFLGKTFLQVLYVSILDDPSGIAYIYGDSKVIGFVAGTSHPAGFYRQLISKRLLHFIFASINPVIQRPGIIPRMLRALNSPREVDPGPACATLMSIAVAPEAQGLGIGKKLVGAFLAEAVRRGMMEVNLTTDALNNEPVNQFYQRYGFSLARSFTTPEGRLMNEYRIKLAAQIQERR